MEQLRLSIMGTSDVLGQDTHINQVSINDSPGQDIYEKFENFTA